MPTEFHQRRARTALFLAVSLSAAPLAVAQWTVVPRVSTGVVHTDNVALQPPAFAQDETAARINPGLSVRKEGGRLNVDLSYELDALFYSEDSDRNESFHNFNAQGEFEVMPRRFWIAGNAVYDQTILTASEPIPLSNVSITSNRSDYWSAEINPYWIEDFGNWSQLRVDYRYGQIAYEDADVLQGSNVDDLERNEVGVRLGSQPDRPGLDWDVTYRTQRIDYQTFGDFQLDSAIADLRYPIGRQWWLIARGGAETDARTDARDGGLQSEIYEAGIRYELGRGEYAEIRAGRRFYGNTLFASIEKSSGRFNANLEYNENPTTVGLEQLLLPDVINNPTGPGFELTDLTNDLYINKELVLALSYTASRMRVDLEGRRIKREFIDSGDDDEERGAGLTVSYRLGPRTSVELYAYRAQIGFPGTTVEDRITQAALSASRRFGRQSLLDLTFRYDRRDSDTVQQANVYREKAVELTFTRWFGRGEASERDSRRGRSLRR